MYLQLEHFILAAIPLFVMVFLFRRMGVRFDSNPTWDAKKDLGLAIVMGIGCSLLCGFWLVEDMLNGVVTGPDFNDYCKSVGAFRDQDMAGWTNTRSVASGWLPAMLSRTFGVIDGLLLGAMISFAVMCAGIFLWARALHGRLAGVVAALMTCAAAPLVQLTRSATFYPEVIAVSVCTAAAAVLALRYRTLPFLFATGFFIGLVLLMDVRGLLWALPALGLGCVAALTRGGAMPRAMGLIAVLLPICLSHPIGKVVYRAGSPTLERQVDFYVDDANRRLTDGPSTPSGRIKDEGFIWGKTRITRIPATLKHILDRRGELSDSIGEHPENAKPRQVQILPWVGIAVGSFLVAAWGLRRRPLLLLALIVAIAPFAAAIHGAAYVLYHARYLASGFAIVPVLLGVVCAIMVQGRLSPSDSGTNEPWSWKKLLVPLILLSMLIGLIPNWYASDAGWRCKIRADENPQRALLSAALNQVGRDADQQCVDALQADFANGLPQGSRLFAWTVGEQEPAHNPSPDWERCETMRSQVLPPDSVPLSPESIQQSVQAIQPSPDLAPLNPEVTPLSPAEVLQLHPDLVPLRPADIDPLNPHSGAVPQHPPRDAVPQNPPSDPAPQ
jgi:hypothetical protein